MPITLFEHNQTAYDAVIKLLEEVKKVCVVHPTETGKSFIAFKYCEDHPDEAILRRSPCSYIFSTQFENVEETGAEVPEIIYFCSCVRLVMVEDSEIADMMPDTIVEDKYHRCGARKWQEGLERLPKQYPDAKQVGLTRICYLDNQSDMKTEIYDDFIASEMTLGEAIARGILNAPRYVLTSYSLESCLNSSTVNKDISKFQGIMVIRMVISCGAGFQIRETTITTRTSITGLHRNRRNGWKRQGWSGSQAKCGGWKAICTQRSIWNHFVGNHGKRSTILRMDLEQERGCVVSFAPRIMIS